VRRGLLLLDCWRRHHVHHLPQPLLLLACLPPPLLLLLLPLPLPHPG
jgi:hypothetical protein